MLTGAAAEGRFALVDPEDLERLSVRPWNYGTHHGYAASVRLINGRQISLRMHREVLGLYPGDGRLVDHINGDKLDNRRSNLRLADKSINAVNVHRLPVTNTSGMIGVRRRDRCPRRPWAASLQGRYIGAFTTVTEAVLARRDAEIEAFGFVSPLTLQWLASEGAGEI